MGLREFDLVAAVEPTSVVFYETDYKYRDARPNRWNAYLVEIFAFRRREWPGVVTRFRRNRLELVYPRRMPQFEVPNTLFEWKIIPTDSRHYFLGVHVSRSTLHFGSPSGFDLGSPGGEVVYDAHGRLISGITLHAHYPLFDDVQTCPSLDYVPQQTAPPASA